MHRLTLLLMASLCLFICHAQQTDTLTLFYGPSAYGLSAASRSRLDAFLQKGWDRLTIRSYTEGPDGAADNLSKRRADGVYRYFVQRNTPAGVITVQYFGEAAPRPTTAPKKAIARSDRFTVGGSLQVRSCKSPLRSCCCGECHPSPFGKGGVRLLRLWERLKGGFSCVTRRDGVT